MMLRHARPLAGLTLLLAASPVLAQPSLFVTQNPPGASGDVIARLPLPLGPRLAELRNVGSTRSIQSIAVAADGTGYVTFDGVAGSTTRGGVIRVPNVGTGTNATIAGGTGRLYGSLVGLTAPKGIFVDSIRTAVTTGGAATTFQALFISDFAAGTIVVHNAASTGNVAPVFTVSDLGGAKPWDSFYDRDADRLFVAATNGTVLIYNTLSTRRGAATPSATITPTFRGAKVTVNLHGIDIVDGFSGTGDQIVLTDVGDAASATDGALLAIPFAGTEAGTVNTPVSFINRGARTNLGNPTDVIVMNGAAIVSEKANSMVMRFENLSALAGEFNSGPTFTRAAASPEGVDLTPAGAIVATLNPTEVADDAIVRYDAMLNVQATFSGLPAITSVESISVAENGGAYVTFDGAGTTGGVFYRAGISTTTVTDDIGQSDGMIFGSNTTLNMPKGLVVVDNRNTLLVANVGAQSIVAFAIGAGAGAGGFGNVAPSFVVSNLGMTAGGTRRAVWDVHYGRSEDRLFAAGTDGVVVVFDNFFANRGVNGPTRTITPTDLNGAKITVNLHGIVHDRGSDVLVLTDVGSAADPNDGQLITIGAGALSSGNVAFRYRVRGPLSRLGNPVDVAVSNGSAFVAEKSNNAIIEFTSVLTATGSIDRAGNAVTVTAPESVWLTGSTATAAEESPVLDGATRFAAYPNPARDRVTLRFSAETSGEVRVEVYDVLGRMVAQMAETVTAGEQTRTLDTSHLAAGTYVLRMTAGATRSTQTLTVAR